MKLILLTLFLLTLSCQKPGKKETAQKSDPIKSAMQQLVDDKKMAGAVTLVMKDGKIVHHETVGHARIDGDHNMEKDSIFSIASMTKVITATAIMILEEEGKLSVHDPVSNYIPEFKNLKLHNGEQPNRKITLVDLMTHTSGMKNVKGNPKNMKEAVALILNQQLSHHPGKFWRYGPGLTICGRIIEIVSNGSYENFLNERIFKPLNMIDTTFHPDINLLPRMAYVYQPSENGNDLLESPASSQRMPQKGVKLFPNPSGGLKSTAIDMAHFYQMLLNGGVHKGKYILSKKQVKKMTKIHVWDFEKIGFTPGSGWGLGCGVIKEPIEVTSMLSPGTFGHGGSRGTQSWGDPERNMVFILMIQRTKFGNGDQSEIRKVFQQLAVDTFNN